MAERGIKKIKKPMVRSDKMFLSLNPERFWVVVVLRLIEMRAGKNAL